MTAPLRLRLDPDALIANWRALDRLSGAAACGAAIKADGYGLGARGVATRLAAAGTRDFFVASWSEAAALADCGLDVAVLHGVRRAGPFLFLRRAPLPSPAISLGSAVGHEYPVTSTQH